jgi:hypothetical protein
MSEYISVIKELQTRLIDLQRQYSLAHTFQSTELDIISSSISIELNDRPGANPATDFITEYTNRAFIKLSYYYNLTDYLI